MIYGEMVTIKHAHGDTALYLLAYVQLDVGGQSITFGSGCICMKPYH